MDFEVSPIDDSSALVRLSGRLDTQGVDQIETRLTATLSAGGHHAMLDLSGVSFIASMGIRMLIANAKAMHLKGRRLALFGATGPVAGVLEAVAIDQIIPVAADQQQALQAINA